MIHVRVADMTAFDQKELLKAFVDKKLEPTWLEAVTPRPDLPGASHKILANESLKKIQGEWRTDDCATRKFWLNVQDGMLRLHTTKLGDWTSVRVPVLDAGEDWIKSEGIQLKYTKDGDVLFVQVTAPVVFQGDFKLFRESGGK